MTEIVPKTIAAGVNFTATAWCPAYSGAEWTLAILLRGPSSIDLAADRDSSRHVWDVPAETTAAWTPGVYAYQVRATNTDGDAVTVESGMRTIARDFAALAPGAEVRSPNRIALDAIEAVIAKRATLDQQRYRINNRELYRESIGELMRLRAHYVELCKREDAGAAGRRLFGRQVKFRMGA